MNTAQQFPKVEKNRPSRAQLLVNKLRKQGYDVDTVPSYLRRKMIEREAAIHANHLLS
jgi:cobalamin biosynthesis Mg chelatase CobN